MSHARFCSVVRVGAIESVQAGRRGKLWTHAGVVRSAFKKQPVAGRVRVGALGLEGDEQADRENHGGPEMALCVYPSEHYPYWAERLGLEMPPAAFGENLTTSGVVETSLEIGAVLRAGDALVQVSQPRAPCFKLAGRHREKRLALWVQQTRYTGWYFRVLEEGTVAAGDPLDVVSAPGHGVTVAEVVRVVYADRGDVDGLERALAAENLSPTWRGVLAQRLARARAA